MLKALWAHMKIRVAMFLKDHPHQAQKKDIPIDLLLSFFQETFFKPRNFSCIFSLVLDVF